MQQTIQFPETGEIDQMNKQVVVQVEGMKISSNDDLILMTEHMKGVNRRIKVVEEKLAGPIELANKTHKALTGLRNELLAPLERAKRYASGEIASWEVRQRRIAQEAAFKARKEAEEAAKVEAEAERRRIESERLSTAVQLEKHGFSDEANQILDQPIIVSTQPTVIIPQKTEPELPKPTGLTVKTTYKAEVFDLRLLVQEVAAGRQPMSLISENDKNLNELARTLKMELNIPGVRVVVEHKAQTRE